MVTALRPEFRRYPPREGAERRFGGVAEGGVAEGEAGEVAEPAGRGTEEAAAAWAGVWGWFSWEFMAFAPCFDFCVLKSVDAVRWSE